MTCRSSSFSRCDNILKFFFIKFPEEALKGALQRQKLKNLVQKSNNISGGGAGAVNTALFIQNAVQLRF